MDSITQVVLGAAVGEAVLGKKVGSRAMLWGAIAGTIPDLDVFLKFFVSDITATEMHRGFSHSLVFAILVAPVLGWLAHKIHRRREDVSFKNWSWLFFWATVTHPLLDAHTTWGTQFFWPLEYRLAYKNIFVVDPLYTVPFLVFLLIALFHKRTNPRRRFFNNIGLIVSTTYMMLTLVFKWISFEAFQERLHLSNITYLEMDVKPTPLNSVLWNAQVETSNGYRVAYYSLFDTKDIEFSHEFPKNHHLLDPYKDQENVKQLLNISAGWYFIEQEGEKLIFYDMRFGQVSLKELESSFIWRYELTIDTEGQVTIKRSRPDIDGVGELFEDLVERIKGN
ncbi:MAG: metal-dependent hydrolase [Crocinitomicaceae bacterium]|nr:metal-dependent hydrolase [Crocinitomicaceae bacterium]MDG1777241.1 metal-dependent hydrolase [Crocinitomicaceae bacterium]